MTYKDAGVTVTAWPPEVLPESWAAFGALRSILTSIRGEPLWEYCENVPPVVLQIAKATGTAGWRAPFIAEVDVRRVSELFERNPGLVALVAYSLPGRIDAIRRIIKTALAGRDKDILKPFGFPSSNSFVRLLSKLRPDCCYPRYYQDLRAAWRIPKKRKLMQHLKCVTRDVCCVLDQPEEVINYALLERAARSLPAHCDVEFGLRMLASEWRISKRAGPWPYGKISYDSIHPALEKLHLERTNAVPFPPPPVEGTPTIVPIRTAKHLFEEGRHQRNCSYSLQEQVRTGTSYFYRVLRSKCRCTLVLDKKEDYWAMSALITWQNNPPSIQAVEEVMAWLRNAFPMTDPADLDLRTVHEDTEFDEDEFRPSAPQDDPDDPGPDMPPGPDFPW
jgi:hypothetical protein